MADVLSLPAAAAPGPDGGRDLDARRSASSTCWPRWPAPGAWSHCCSGIDGRAGQSLVIAVVGVLMIIYVLVGGMKGTTWVQIIKAVLLVIGRRHHDALGARASTASTCPACSAPPSTSSPTAGEKLLDPGLQYGATGISKLDFISLALALVLGTAGLPHVLMRFYTVPYVQGGPPQRRLGDLDHRHLLPVHPGPRVRRGCAGRPGRDPGRSRQGELGRTAAGLRTRRRAPARRHLGGRLRHHPGGGGRPDDHRERVVRPRRLRPGDQEGPGQRRRRGPGRPDHRGGDRRRSRSSAASSPTARTSPSWWRWRSRSRPSANLPTILYSLFWRRLQHPRRAVEHLRRPDLGDHPDRVLARSSPARWTRRPAPACR